jgi:hypothetical protein
MPSLIRNTSKPIDSKLNTTGEYRSIGDVGEGVWFVGVHKIVDEYANKIQTHNHYPSNDAHHNYVTNLISIGIAAELKKEDGRNLGGIAAECGKRVVSMIQSNGK